MLFAILLSMPELRMNFYLMAFSEQYCKANIWNKMEWLRYVFKYV